MLSFDGINKRIYPSLGPIWRYLPGFPAGRAAEISFSLCWMSKDVALERLNGNLWLNDTSLKRLSKGGKVTSLTVSPAVENKLTLQYGGSVQAWTVRVDPRTKFTKIRGLQKPLKQPASFTKDFLEKMSPDEVFSCENGTVFFHQDENFFLAFGYTMRLPVKLESRTTSELQVSWVDPHPAVSRSHTMTLYNTDMGSYKTLSMDSPTSGLYHFTALDSCSCYAACVEPAATHTFTCLSTITDPDIPKDFGVTLWNSSSISLAWDYPENCKFSFFLLTAFYLSGTDQITEEVLFWHKEDTFVFVLSDLEPCTRVRFGLQTVCQAGIESRYSKMVLNEGNSVHSTIEALCQTSYGPDNYTLSWEARNTSSISMFRVYHDGELQGTTLITSFTVGGLQPCQQHQATVEALCGDGVLMNAKTVAAHTGPLGVSELRYRSKDSSAQWKPRTTHQPGVAFAYELSLENGATIQTSRVTDTQLPLPGLEEGKTYALDVWEECDGQWESKRSHVCFEGANSSLKHFGRAAGSPLDQEPPVDPFSMALTMVVPWSLPEDLLDDGSGPRAEMGKTLQDKLQEMLNDFHLPARVELVAIEPAGEPNKTDILFISFDASKTEEDVPLPVEDQLDYIHSLNTDHMAVADGLIHWEGPDLCASSKRTLCPPNSLCINTLGSYACLCQHGYYDVSSVIEPPVASHPVCNEKGLFSHCLGKLTGGIAKPYLASYIGGKLDVRLNDGSCTVVESEMFYHFRISRKASECGTERRVNKTHIQFLNTLTVTIRDQTITRRDLKVVWKCVYPRHYIRHAQVGVDVEWLSSVSLVALNSSLQLGLTMTLYADELYAHSYRDAITLGPEDTLFFQVALQTNNSFASDVLLQVESCWATESPDPQDTVQGVLLQDGCAVDTTFRWLSVNGLAQSSRFSLQMFSMPKGLPIYMHCLANICVQDEDCTKSCSSQQRTKRSRRGSRMDPERTQAAVVSAGPLVVNRRGTSAVPQSYWPEHMISIVAGSIGFLGVTVLSVSATKAIMTYYERLRLK
ncbi:uncharacterized protein LOC117939989 [Etheostoma cragini]|uniref:uncharacterized protein LOC117939989 n=1 Tax=Etheostoma cragini TaxID=417921 RepID=UPI00155E427C|nr:uncharacterized protein LOC117939989 [Etheostoma cragini]